MADVKSDATNDKSLSKDSLAGTTAKRVIERHRKSSDGPRVEDIPSARETPPADTKAYDKVIRELEKLYSPEAFAPIVGAPADLMVMFTGRKLWELKDTERKSMAVAASVTAKYFMPTDPKMVALLMLAGSFATIYGGRAVLHYKEIIKEKKENAKNPN